MQSNEEQIHGAQDAVLEDGITGAHIESEMLEGESDPPPIQEIDVDALLEERDRLAADRDELRDQVLRARAEFDNFRKRTAREHERMRVGAAAGIIQELLPILDNLELALQHAINPEDSLVQGVEMVVRQFRECLRRAGLEPIEAVGQPFDPMVHEAVMQETSDEAAPNTVLREFQRGYRLGEQVLRPAKVVVSAGGPEPEPADQAGPQS